VPGKGFVGIEVPNAETSLVSLRDIMEGPEFARLDTKLRIGLGQSVDGTPVAADLTAMPHLLIAGTTGSGKSVCVNAIIACLLLENTPEDLRMIMVDPKRVELTGYNGIPHLVAPVVVDLERIVGVLKWVTREMDDRYRKFNERGARNILSFNGMLEPGEKKLPYLIVIVDELADLMMLAPDETERVLTRLAQMSRATGIHLIISTQRPSVDVVTGLIKANFPARVAFAVASSVDSRVILDQPGAERLLGRGDMLFQAPDAAAPVRLQGVFVSDTELTRLVNHWKGLRPIEEAPRPAAALETGLSGGTSSRGGIPTIQSRGEKYSPTTPSRSTAAPWEEMSNTSSERKIRPSGDDVDDLYDEAVEVVRRLKKASVSLLQRQLRIGYTRAARLIDVMEERSVVGPAQSGSKPRKVIGYSDDDIDLSLDDDEDDDAYLDDENDKDDA
jgi:S-DNA-T family DNA segregation ATPase FtsK/SpoIIIE